MKFKKILATAVLILSTHQAQAGEAFTLKGITKTPPPGACFLYVDAFGYDESFEGPNKFYADVRTSFAPQDTIHLVAPAGHGKRSVMVSQETDGAFSRRLTVQLRGPASEHTLYRAASYRGLSESDTPHALRIQCAYLRAVTP